MDNFPGRQCLRNRFFVKRHRGWGAAVCWYEWNEFFKSWGMNWGIACKTIREAKVIRKFLNARTRVFSSDYGVSFDEARRFALGNTLRKD